MADTDIVQVIAETRVDARSLSEFVFKPAGFKVTRRLAPPIDTLQFYIDRMNSTDAEFAQALIDAQEQAEINTTVALNNALIKVDSKISKAIADVVETSGFTTVDSFELGATITQRNQALRQSSTNRLYRWTGNLPKTVEPSTLPSSDAKWLEVSDVTLKQDLASDTGYRKVANQMAANAYGIPAPIYDVVRVTATVGVVGVFDGFWWGCGLSDRHIYKSTDQGDTWVKYANGSGAAVSLLKPTGNGEVLELSATGIRKSTNWSSNPSAITWAFKVQRPEGNVADFLKWGFDGSNDGRFAVTHYSSTRGDSRYIWYTSDFGDTWDIVYDSNTAVPVNGASSHIHALCYDAWDDRWYFSEGHEAIAGVYYTDDNFATIKKAVDLINGTPREPSFTTMTATDFGIVCGSDGHPNGVWVIRRSKNPDDIEFEWLAAWEKNQSGVLGFADHSFRDSDTGIVYVSFGNAGSGNYLTVPNVIYAVGSMGASIVWQTSEGRVHSVFVDKGILWAKIGAAFNGNWIKAKTSKYSGSIKDAVRAQDRGNLGVGEGEYTQNSCLRVGFGSSTVGATDSITIGRYSKVLGQYQVAVGNQATTGLGLGCTAVGYLASSTGTDSVAFGRDSGAAGSFSVAIGSRSAATSTNAIAVGYLSSSALGIAIGKSAASTGASSSIAIGQDSVSSAGISIGNSSKATGAFSVAVGNSAEATSTHGTAFGNGAKAAQGLAVGSGAIVTGNDAAIAIGRQANSTGGVALGKSAVTNGSFTIAIGESATATSTNGVAIGRLASATVGVAIGANSSAAQTGAVALGDGTVSTKLNTVTVGARDIESTKNGGKVYLKSPNGTGYYISISDAGAIVITAA